MRVNLLGSCISFPHIVFIALRKNLQYFSSCIALAHVWSNITIMVVTCKKVALSHLQVSCCSQHSDDGYWLCCCISQTTECSLCYNNENAPRGVFSKSPNKYVALCRSIEYVHRIVISMLSSIWANGVNKLVKERKTWTASAMDAGIMYLSYNNHVCMQYSFKDYYIVFLLFGNEQQKVYASYTYNVISEAFS